MLELAFTSRIDMGRCDDLYQASFNNEKKMHFWRFALVLIVFAVSAAHAIAAESIEGIWEETANYPASSALRFEREGGKWVGRYIEVSELQRRWGFAEGEAVVRGKITKNVFRGKVLLKDNPGLSDKCRKEPAHWAPIEMRLTEGGALSGAWLQTMVNPLQNCRVIQQKWQPYVLERQKTRN